MSWLVTRMLTEWHTVIDGGIPILGGLYATALGYGVIGASQSSPSPLKQKFLVRFPAGDANSAAPVTIVLNWQAGLKK